MDGHFNSSRATNMKVTLLFCLLAVYGAVAEDAEVDTDVATSTDDSASSVAASALDTDSSIASKFTAGNFLDKMAGAVDGGLLIKDGVVNGSLEIIKDGVELASTAAQQALSGGKDIMQKGLETAENIKTTATTHAGSMVDKTLGIAKTVTGGMGSSIFGAMNSTAQASIKAGDIAATHGIIYADYVGSKGMDLSSSLVGKFGNDISSALNAAGRVDKAINAHISTGVNNAVEAASSLGQKAGKLVTSFWKLPSKSSS